MASDLHISISAEKIFSVGPLNISNSILTSLIVSALLILFFWAVNKNLSSKGKKIHPLQNLAELILQGFYDLIQGITGDIKKTRFFMPYFTAFFFFILINNWFGLIPGVGTIGFIESAEGTEHAVLLQQQVDTVADVYAVEEATDVEEEVVVMEEGDAHVESAEVTTAEEAEHSEVFVPYLRAGTADINTTMALSLFTMIFVQVVGIKYQGLKYFKKFINFSNPINSFVALLETVSEFAKVISFTFRLFGNIFAGEVLLVVIGSLIPIIAPMPFYGLEIFVGLIQALVFAMLSIVFFNSATVSHDGDH